MSEVLFKKTKANSIRLMDLPRYLPVEDVDVFAPIYLYIKIPLSQNGDANPSHALTIHNYIHSNTSVDMNFIRTVEGGVNYMNSYITLNKRDVEVLAKDLGLPPDEILRFKSDATPHHHEKYFFMVEGYSILWNVFGTSCTSQGVKIKNLENTYIIPKIIQDTYSVDDLCKWKDCVSKVHNFMVDNDCLYTEGFQLQCKADLYMVCGTRGDFSMLEDIINDFDALMDIKNFLLNDEQYKHMYHSPKLFS